MLKAGFLGPRGTFSQEALEVYMKGKEYTGVPYPGIPDILMAVQDSQVDEGLVPIENSLEGAVNVTLDMIAADVDVRIRAELAIPVRQHLLAQKGSEIRQIQRVLSHPQPVGQCRRFLNSRLSGAEISFTSSTAAAADEVSRGNGEIAAIGSATAARVYGLHILADNIQDEDNNLTRFVVAAKKDSECTGFDKTSIVFSTEDKPGSLYRILDIFNLWDINMTRIESRPAKNQLGRYIFFVDITGHRNDEAVSSALTMVKRKTSFYKFLGSYPAYTVES